MVVVVEVVVVVVGNGLFDAVEVQILRLVVVVVEEVVVVVNVSNDSRMTIPVGTSAAFVCVYYQHLPVEIVFTTKHYYSKY